MQMGFTATEIESSRGDLIFVQSEVAMLTASELMKVLEEDMLLCPKSTDDCCSAIAT